MKRSEYDGEQISIQHKIWMGKVGSPKTEAREAGLFVIPVLRKIPVKYKKAIPPGVDVWIFRGEKFLRPLDLDNLSRRDILQHSNGAWFGWHSFRHGWGTRLNEAGVNSREIQAILRHADVPTTMAYHILLNHKRANVGLKKLGQVAQRKYGIKV